MKDYEVFFEECRDAIKDRAERCVIALEHHGLHGEVSFESDGVQWAYVVDVRNHAEMPRISFSLAEFEYAEDEADAEQNEEKVMARLEIVGFGGSYIGEANGEWTNNKDAVMKDFNSFADVSIVEALSGPKKFKAKKMGK
jgi:hypothetical protein